MTTKTAWQLMLHYQHLVRSCDHDWDTLPWQTVAMQRPVQYRDPREPPGFIPLEDCIGERQSRQCLTCGKPQIRSRLSRSQEPAWEDVG